MLNIYAKKVLFTIAAMIALNLSLKYAEHKQWIEPWETQKHSVKSSACTAK